MTTTLFGKLPAKRDFVARHVPGPFQATFEPWLQEALAVSRQRLGEGWTEAYLSAPIWRFWLPPALTGAGALGALMPSVDGIGRYFPLMIAVIAPNGRGFAHPSYEPHAAWFDAVEGILLNALEESVTLETIAAWLGHLREPPVADLGELVAPEDRERLSERSPRMAPLGPGLHRLRRPAPPPYEVTAWWTLGGEHFPATALAWDGLPDTSFFVDMIKPPMLPESAASEDRPDRGRTPSPQDVEARHHGV